MKKIQLYIMAAMTAMCGMFTSCNEDWEEEVYEQLVSFKAPVGSNGVHDIYVRYKADGTGQFKLPVIISGSATNHRDFNVKIGVDNDTLDILNKARFASGREDLWFRQLPENFYSFPSQTCHVAPGQNTNLYIIDFNLKGLDTNENWVLPLTVMPDPS